MVVIRLTRIGRKKKAIFRLVAADKRAPVKGKFIEILGQYRPQDKKNKVTVFKDRVLYWLEKGAKPSDTVTNLLCDLKILPEKQRIKKTVTRIKKKKEKEVKLEKPAVIEAPTTKKPKGESILEEGLEKKIEETKEKEELKEKREEVIEEKKKEEKKELPKEGSTRQETEEEKIQK